MAKINSRTKGAAAEREAAKLIEDHLGFRCKRNLMQTAEGGHDLIGIPGWAVEVKRYAQASNAIKEGWWQQAVRQANEVGAKPVVLYRLDRSYWRALLEMPGSYFAPGDFRGVVDIDAELFFAIAREELNCEY